MISRVVVESAPVVLAGFSFPKVVALGLGIVSTQPLPINLVQIIGLQYSRADYALAWGSLDSVVQMAKHYVELGGDEWRVPMLCHGELCTI